MKCNHCNYPAELTWPENYKKGDRPINSETGQIHDCRIVSTGGFLCGYCLETFGINFVLYEKHRCVFRN